MWCETFPYSFLLASSKSDVRKETWGERGIDNNIRINLFSNTVKHWLLKQGHISRKVRFAQNLSSSSPSFKQIIEVTCATQHSFTYSAQLDQCWSYIKTSRNHCCWNRRALRWAFCLVFVTLSLSTTRLSYGPIPQTVTCPEKKFWKEHRTKKSAQTLNCF